MRTIQVTLKINVQDGNPSISMAFEANAKYMAEHGWEKACEQMEAELVRRFRAAMETGIKQRVVTNRRNLSVVTAGIKSSHEGDSNG